MKKEEWKQFIEFNGIYWVSNYGAVKTVYKNGKERILKPNLTSFGYKRIQLSNRDSFKNYFVHVLVAKLFIENIYNKPFVNHKNSNRADNYFENLEWVTKSENHIHGFEEGHMSNMGEHNPRAKLKETDVIDIFNSRESIKELMIIYGVGYTAISNIKKKKAWGHVLDNFKF